MRRKAFTVERNRAAEKIDVPFLLIAIVLCGLGLTTLYSGSIGYAERIFGDPLHFVKRQCVNLAVGVVACAFLSMINLEKVRVALPKIVIATLVLMVLPFFPGIGITLNGASRWIHLGFTTFQPSELVKGVIVIFLANLFAKKHDRLDEPNVSVYPAAFMSALFVAIVYLQNDFSTSIFILAVVLVMFFFAGVGVSWFVRLFLVMLPLVAIMVLSKAYRVERVLSFLHPESDPLGAGYQVNAALQALSEGGFWGRGLGNGIRKISSIPEVQSDFIFAVWGEEMGFLGVLAYFALIVSFSLRGFWLSLRAPDRFRCLLGLGCTFVILFQSLLNCGVVIRLFPATGIALPFFSSGGSSLLITLSLCGLIINVSRRAAPQEGDIQNV